MRTTGQVESKIGGRPYRVELFAIDTDARMPVSHRVIADHPAERQARRGALEATSNVASSTTSLAAYADGDPGRRTRRSKKVR